MKKEIAGMNIWLFVSLVLLLFLGFFFHVLGSFYGTIEREKAVKLCEENGMVFVDREYVDRDSLTVTCLEFDDDSGLVEERRFRR